MSPKSFHLMQYHQRLDTDLRVEIARRWPDMLRIQKLKKTKAGGQGPIEPDCHITQQKNTHLKAHQNARARSRA